MKTPTIETTSLVIPCSKEDKETFLTFCEISGLSMNDAATGEILMWIHGYQYDGELQLRTELSKRIKREANLTLKISPLALDYTAKAAEQIGVDQEYLIQKSFSGAMEGMRLDLDMVEAEIALTSIGRPSKLSWTISNLVAPRAEEAAVRNLYLAMPSPTLVSARHDLERKADVIDLFESSINQLPSLKITG